MLPCLAWCSGHFGATLTRDAPTQSRCTLQEAPTVGQAHPIDHTVSAMAGPPLHARQQMLGVMCMVLLATCMGSVGCTYVPCGTTHHQATPLAANRHNRIGIFHGSAGEQAVNMRRPSAALQASMPPSSAQPQGLLQEARLTGNQRRLANSPVPTSGDRGADSDVAGGAEVPAGIHPSAPHPPPNMYAPIPAATSISDAFFLFSETRPYCCFAAPPACCAASALTHLLN